MRRAAITLGLLWMGGLACGDPSGPETPIEGAKLYNQHCARCHGTDGAGVTEYPTTRELFSRPQALERRSDQALMGVIRRGKPPNMPAFEGEFTEAKIMILVAYIRSLSSTSPPAAVPGSSPE